MVMRRAGRTLIATLLCGSLAALTASSTALAQGRGNSGLPAGPGNAAANLQQQINALEQQMESLNTQVELLGSQMGQGSDRKLAVYDAIEQKVGDLIGVQDSTSGPPVPWVAVTVGSRTFVLQVMPQQLIGQNLWFDGANCTGNTFLSGITLNKGQSAFALAAVHELEGMVYAADPKDVPVQRNVTSVWGPSKNVCENFAAAPMKTLQASPVLNIRNFQEPYSIR